MKTERKLCLALKSMMSEQPLESISVIALTKKCNIYRQTFYYHFHDIYDLLSLVYIEEKIDKINEVENVNDLLEKIFSYYSNNSKFIEATLNSNAKDLFKEFVYNNCLQAFIILLDKINETKIVSAMGKKSVARFYASAFSNAITYALDINRVKTFKQFSKELCFIDDEDLEISIKKLIRKELVKK